MKCSAVLSLIGREWYRRISRSRHQRRKTSWCKNRTINLRLQLKTLIWMQHYRRRRKDYTPVVLVSLLVNAWKFFNLIHQCTLPESRFWWMDSDIWGFYYFLHIVAPVLHNLHLVVQAASVSVVTAVTRLPSGLLHWEDGRCRQVCVNMSLWIAACVSRFSYLRWCVRPPLPVLSAATPGQIGWHDLPW